MNNLAAEAETAARQGEIKMLYNITKKLSGRLQNNNIPVRNKEGKLIKTILAIDEELKRWIEHFEKVLNRPDPENLPDPPPWPDLQVRKG